MVLQSSLNRVTKIRNRSVGFCRANNNGVELARWYSITLSWEHRVLERVVKVDLGLSGAGRQLQHDEVSRSMRDVIRHGIAQRWRVAVEKFPSAKKFVKSDCCAVLGRIAKVERNLFVEMQGHDSAAHRGRQNHAAIKTAPTLEVRRVITIINI